MLFSFDKSLRATLWAVLSLALAVGCAHAQSGGSSSWLPVR